MLGIPDPWVWGAYVLCVLSTLLCVVYGLLMWNKEAERESEEIQEEQTWEEVEEKEIQDNL